MSEIPTVYLRLKALVKLLLMLFFRRVEVTGLEHIPNDRGGILVAWHPNGLIDPLLIVGNFTRQVVFGARHGLFKYPVLGWLMKQMGTVPIYRRVDLKGVTIEEQRRLNAESLKALSNKIASGSFSALFPEGISHDTPFLQELKSGAARLYYSARSQTPSDQPPPVIIPVGLHYDHKRGFRSRAFIEFHPPVELTPKLDVNPQPDEPEDVARERARALTAILDRRLKEVILETESWELYELFQRTRSLIRAERAHRAEANPGRTNMRERVTGMARIWHGYQLRAKEQPEVIAGMVQRVREYSETMLALGMQDHELDRAPPLFSFWTSIVLVLQVASIFILLPPFLLIGYAVNLPPMALLKLASKLAAKKKKDEATIKMLGGAVLFPLTWGLWGWFATFGYVKAQSIYPHIPDNPLIAGLIVVLLGIVGVIIVVGYMAAARAALRSVSVRFTRALRKRTIERLRVERSALCDLIISMGQDLELPGVVRDDGRISRDDMNR